MKKTLIAVGLFAATVFGIALYPALHSNAGTVGATSVNSNGVVNGAAAIANLRAKPQIEVVFVLDTTSSMSGFITAAKEKIWSIASSMATADPAPEIKIGLVAFRDRGDSYVTKVTDLSTDLDTVYATLMDYQAQGGGDGPESVNQALNDAVTKISWSQTRDNYKLIFLVGDAPPHMDYTDEMRYPETLALAAQRGIVVNTVQSGTNQATTREWERIASLSQGEFFNVASNGNAVAVATPFDRELAQLSAKLDETRIYFGDAKEKAKQKLKTESTAKLNAYASIATKARRASFNATPSGAKNLLGTNELVDAVTSGRVELDEIAEQELPASLAAAAPRERKLIVEQAAGKRANLQEKITVLAKKRDDYIAKELVDDADVEASLDHQIFDTVRRQAAAKGLKYSDAPKY